jgi:4-amino-4-deoxy-L-arabinose transferase-like glycosyltransferase
MKQKLTKFIESPWGVPIALGLLHLILALMAFHESPYSGGDDATYLSLARSLLTRHEYRDIWDPAMPLHTQYPPVFPLIVAAALGVGLDPVIGVRLLMVLISTGAVFASCLWLRRVTTPWIAVSAGLFIALSPEVIRLGMEILSDYTFWLFSMLAALAWLRAERDAESQKTSMPVAEVIVAAALTVLAYFTRSAGAPLLLAVLIWLAMRKEFRAALITIAIAAPPIVLWWARGRNAGGGGYLAPFLAVDPYNPSRGNVKMMELVTRFGKNVHDYASRHIPRMIYGTPKPMIILGAAICIAGVVGWWMRAKKPSLSEVWFPIYIALVLLWPVTWGGPRFLMPVAALLALYFAEPLSKLAHLAQHPRDIALAFVAAGVILIFPDLKNQIQIGTDCRGRYAEGEQFPCTDPAFAEFFMAAEKSRGNLPAGSVVLSRKPTIFFVHSGYQSRLYPLFPVPDSLFNLAARIHAKYLVIDQITDLAPRYLHPILLARRDDFCVIPELSLPNAAFAKIEIGGPPRPPGSAPNQFRACPLTAATSH